MLTTSLYSSKKILGWLLLAAVWLVGCNTPIAHWPGLSASGNKAYVAYGSQVIALDMDAKQQLWSYAGEGSVQFYAPPAVRDGTLVLGDYGSSGGLFSTGLTVSVYALDESAGANTPTKRWLRDDIITGRVFAEPLYLDDLVIVGTSDNQIVALNTADGSKKWEFSTGNAIWSQPAHKDNLIFVTSVDRRVYALDHDTGTVVWETELTGANASSPVVDDNLVYVGSFDSTLHAFDMLTGAEVWTAPAQDWVWGKPLYADGIVYYTDLAGYVYAVDGRTGEAAWPAPIQVTGSIQAAPILDGDTLYIASTDPSTVELPQGYITAISRTDGSPVWNRVVQVNAPIHATPVVVGNSLVIAVVQNDSAALEVLQYDLQNGTQLWSFVPEK